MTFESDEVRAIAGAPEGADRGGRLDGAARAARPAARGPILFAVLAGVAALAIFLSPPDGQPFAARLAILALGIVAAWKVLGRSAAVTASSPERFELDLRRPPVPVTEISGLRSVETDLRMSTASAFGLEFRLKPMLRDLASWRLARNHGIDMTASPDAARGILGEPLWELITPAPSFPEFRSPGAPLEAVEAGLDRLARI